jgi:hypothetical protein
VWTTVSSCDYDNFFAFELLQLMSLFLTKSPPKPLIYETIHHSTGLCANDERVVNQVEIEPSSQIK